MRGLNLLYYRESAVVTLQKTKQIISASIYLQIDCLIDGNFVWVETHIGMYTASYIRAESKSFNNLLIYFQYHHQVTCWQHDIFLSLPFKQFLLLFSFFSKKLIWIPSAWLTSRYLFYTFLLVTIVPVCLIIKTFIWILLPPSSQKTPTKPQS